MMWSEIQEKLSQCFIQYCVILILVSTSQLSSMAIVKNRGKHFVNFNEENLSHKFKTNRHNNIENRGSTLQRIFHEREKRTVNFRMREKQILDSILGESRYDKRIRPGGINSTEGKSSTIVIVNILLRSINDIDDYKMEYSVQVTFREQWNDERLTFDDLNGRLKYLTLTDPGKVWMPDTFFRNEKTGHFHSILVNNVYVRIFPNGDVLYSIRISLTLSCPMNLKLYPMDRQTCSLKIASYGYTTDDITYIWKRHNPFQIPQNLSLPRFSIEDKTVSYCNVRTNTGEYSCLSVDIVFKRQFSYYLITIYVPGCMLVIVSWVSFWLDPHAVPARVSLGVTTLLTMSTQTASIGSALPPVAYTKAIDVWQGVCVTFVFSALLEYALVNYALRANSAYRKMRLKRELMKAKGYHYNDDDDNGLAMQEDSDDEYYDPEGIQPGYLFADRRSNEHDKQLRQQQQHLPVHLQQLNGTCQMHRKQQQQQQQQQQQEENLLFSNVGMKLSTGGNNDAHANNNGGGRLGSAGLAFPFIQNGQRQGRTTNSMDKAKRIDVISRVLFPLVFAVFNLAYWSHYLMRAAEEFDMTQRRKLTQQLNNPTIS